MLANRLRPLLDKIISPNQGAFVKGRWIAENSIIAQELVHKIKSHKGKNGLLLMKIDLKKAYSRLEWSFVDRSLSAWGFSEDFQRIILSCLSSVEYSLLINGDQSESFSPNRGLRQGDPLSPYLFILCSEFVTRLINKEEEEGRIKGIKICRDSPSVSHLMYADDLLVVCRANMDNVEAVWRCFETYCAWSSQAINLDK